MTDKDLDRLGYNEAISFTCAGGKPGNIYQLMTTLDKRFMAGFAYVLGIRAMKASVIRVGNAFPNCNGIRFSVLIPIRLFASLHLF